MWHSWSLNERAAVVFTNSVHAGLISSKVVSVVTQNYYFMTNYTSITRCLNKNIFRFLSSTVLTFNQTWWSFLNKSDITLSVKMAWILQLFAAESSSRIHSRNVILSVQLVLLEGILNRHIQIWLNIIIQVKGGFRL